MVAHKLVRDPPRDSDPVDLVEYGVDRGMSSKNNTTLPIRRRFMTKAIFPHRTAREIRARLPRCQLFNLNFHRLFLHRFVVNDDGEIGREPKVSVYVSFHLLSS